MIFHYKYRRAAIDDLHREVRRFIRRLRKLPLTKQFRVDRWCEGILLQKAKKAPTLKKHLSAFYKSYKVLNGNDQKKIQDAFVDTNRISRQLGGASPRIAIDQLPAAVQKPIKTLFVYLYENTIRSNNACRDHWRIFYDGLTDKTCPFCGIEILHYPEHYKQDYDHVLCKKIYPFASVNMRNLVPMGRDCNTIFKSDVDVLYDGKISRRFPDPFGEKQLGVLIDLSGSIRPQGSANPGSWSVGFSPASDEIQRWAQVFKLSSRYENDYLKLKYWDWVDEFLTWSVGKMSGRPPRTEDHVRDLLKRYLVLLEAKPLFQHNFLKAGLFRFMIVEDSSPFLRASAKFLEIEEQKI